MTSPQKSNLDLTGRVIVRRGSIVSWGGLRVTVSRVRLGRCCLPVFGDSLFGRWLLCASVQVVLPTARLLATLPAICAGREGDPLAGKGRGLREAHPVGNTGSTSVKAKPSQNLHSGS